MRGHIAGILFFVATTAYGQDSSFSRLRVRGAGFRLPVAGHLADDWRAGTGTHVELGSNVGRSDVALSVGRVRFHPVSGHPPFTGTLVSLSWTAPLVRLGAAGVTGGARLTDVRFHFDDPAFVAGLRNEEEVLLSAVARARAAVGGGFGAFIEGSYGALMLATKTPIGSVAIGVEHDAAMPRWLRGFLR